MPSKPETTSGAQPLQVANKAHLQTLERWLSAIESAQLIDADYDLIGEVEKEMRAVIAAARKSDGQQ